MISFRNHISAYIILLLILIATACNSTPDYVIPHEEMASLLADIYKGESVVEYNRAVYNNDSMKKVMKQSVYARHGVTAEQVDTSFVWYGHHVEEYIKVNDRAIEILEHDLDAANNADSSNSLQLAIAGDSVDTWQSARHFKFDTSSPARYVSFVMTPDDNWENGDNYLWQFKTINGRSSVSSFIGIDYEDGTSEFTSRRYDEDGWSRIRLTVDSTRVPTRLYGYLRVAPVNGENIYVDSVSLIRTRVNPLEYNRRYQLSRFSYGKPETSDDE